MQKYYYTVMCRQSLDMSEIFHGPRDYQRSFCNRSFKEIKTHKCSLMFTKVKKFLSQANNPHVCVDKWVLIAFYLKF